MALWWLLLLSCWKEPVQSGPAALVGVLLDPQGAPIRGQVVESIEARDVTDAEGRFAVEFKAPNQVVHFARDGVWYSRRYAPTDTGKVVTLALPPTGDTPLRCRLAEPCDLTLEWDLGDPFVARVVEECTPDRVVELIAVPLAVPDAVCRSATSERPAVVRAVGEAWQALPEPQPVRVEVRGEGEMPACHVRVGEEAPAPTGDGAWLGAASGPVTISATCGNRPALPRTADVLAPATVVLDWSPVGPDLDLARWMPGADRLELVAVAGEEPGWRIGIHQASDGLFHLPPLPAGDYRVVVGDGRVEAEVEGEVRPGVLRTVDLQRSPQEVVTGLTGFLHLDEDMLEGRIGVEGP